MFYDYDRQIAFVAEIPSSDEPAAAIVGVGRLVRIPGEREAELAVLVSDAFQNRGIGSRLTERLLTFAANEKLKLVTASVLAENRPMQKLLEKLGSYSGSTWRMTS
ncbi:MAG: GNAT family N-acetyltransferase [Acidobacteria bacterium]|nr:GNAT family N-acetyltransferase [Acidobacteriota bacterium]